MTTVTAPVIYLLMAIAPDGTALIPEAGNPPMFMTQKSCLEARAEYPANDQRLCLRYINLTVSQTSISVPSCDWSRAAWATR